MSRSGGEGKGYQLGSRGREGPGDDRVSVRRVDAGRVDAGGSADGPGTGPSVILERRYPLSPRAVTSARRALEALADRLPRPVLEDLRLLVSELVGNSVRHAPVGPGATVLVRVGVAADLVRVEVTDPGRGFEVPGRDLGGIPGLGLLLVDRLADRWGVEPSGATRVWLELDLARRRPARPGRSGRPAAG